MLKTNETEQEYVNKLIPTFSKHFTVTQEVWSKCKNGRIDLVLTLKGGVSGSASVIARTSEWSWWRS